MKSSRHSQEGEGQKGVLRRLADGIFWVFETIIRIVLVLGSLVVSIGMLIWFAELIFPRSVHVFNSNISSHMLSTLMESHRYHAAIALMETKEGLISDSRDPYEWRVPLADCYVHTGDYTKALEQYRLIREWYARRMQSDPPTELSATQLRLIETVTDINFLKEEYRIHLKMGDIPAIRRQHARLDSLQASIDWDRLYDDLGEDVGEGLAEIIGDIPLKDGFRLELIQGHYLTDPDRAVADMEEYTLRVNNSQAYNPVYKLRLYNELLRMLIGSGRRLAARYYLEQALGLVDGLQYNDLIFEPLGDLSEYCHTLGDAESGRRLLRRYLHFIDDTYDSSDIEYAVAHAREFKYLEAEGDTETLVRRVAEASATMRDQISRNFTGMTSGQREWFVGQFRPLLTYADRLMEVSPSPLIAETCFDNNAFLRGLLLRSETSVPNAIAAMGDKGLKAKYDRYVALSREVVARRYVSGPGNYIARLRAEHEMESLESEIAAASREFRRSTATAGLTARSLSRRLGRDEVAVQIIEGEHSMHALVLDASGRITSHRLGGRRETAALAADPGALYTDHERVGAMLGTLLPRLKGRRVYLTVSGAFNQVAVPALPIDGAGRVLGDVAEIRLVGSPTEIPAVKSREPVSLASRTAVLWGDVDYTAASGFLGDSLRTPSPVSVTRGIMRGDILGRLPASGAEVDEIASVLRAGGARTRVFKGREATERSLTSLSGRHPYLLHVSTHGFFHDSGSFTDPMRNSGLLFAGSQPYWSTDTLVSSLAETDGILRADEIARLDLSGCRLVVLSACRTGLGEYNSEGVYGLQRAFRLAGAGSILMSLWSVDDEATRRLMTHFYRELAAGRTPAAALAAARRHLRAQGASPDKWVPFILLE